MFEKILETIKKYNRIIIHRHNNPDGDALGCQVGLKHILKDSFPEKEPERSDGRWHRLHQDRRPR